MAVKPTLYTIEYNSKVKLVIYEMIVPYLAFT